MVQKWLETKYLEWQLDKGRKSITAFAEYLDIPQPVLSHYMTGRYKPSGLNVERLASKLGPEIYDLLGLARPDPWLEEIRDAYDRIDQSGRQRFMAIVREIAELQKGLADEPGEYIIVTRASKADAGYLVEIARNLPEDVRKKLIDELLKGEKNDE